MAGTSWTESKTQVLLHVWSDQFVQLKLKAVSKNRTIYEAIARSLTNMGYEKMGQCKTKIKNLTAKSRKVKDGNRKSGNSLDSSFVYFEEMDAVLDRRAASETPPLLLDSGVPDAIVDIVHGESFSPK